MGFILLDFYSLAPPSGSLRHWFISAHLSERRQLLSLTKVSTLLQGKSKSKSKSKVSKWAAACRASLSPTVDGFCALIFQTISIPGGAPLKLHVVLPLLPSFPRILALRWNSYCMQTRFFFSFFPSRLLPLCAGLKCDRVFPETARGEAVGGRPAARSAQLRRRTEICNQGRPKLDWFVSFPCVVFIKAEIEMCPTCVSSNHRMCHCVCCRLLPRQRGHQRGSCSVFWFFFLKCQECILDERQT